MKNELSFPNFKIIVFRFFLMMKVFMAGNDSKNFTYDAFISHASEDAPWCQKFIEKLKHNNPNLRIWFDQVQMQTAVGSVYDILGQNLEKSRHFVPVMTPIYFQKPWAQAELKAAISKDPDGSKQFVIPIMLKDCERPTFLRDLKYFDFQDETTFSEYCNVVARVLTSGAIIPDPIIDKPEIKKNYKTMGTLTLIALLVLVFGLWKWGGDEIQLDQPISRLDSSSAIRGELQPEKPSTSDLDTSIVKKAKEFKTSPGPNSVQLSGGDGTKKITITDSEKTSSGLSQKEQQSQSNGTDVKPSTRVFPTRDSHIVDIRLTQNGRREINLVFYKDRVGLILTTLNRLYIDTLKDFSSISNVLTPNGLNTLEQAFLMKRAFIAKREIKAEIIFNQGYIEIGSIPVSFEANQMVKSKLLYLQFINEADPRLNAIQIK